MDKICVLGDIMALYETWHRTDPEYFLVERNRNFSYPFHSHFCYEIISLLDGEMSVTVDGREHLLQPGMMAVIFPHQIHSMATRTESTHTLCIFSPEIIGRYSIDKRGLRPVNPVFKPPVELHRLFCALSCDDSIYSVKGTLYSLLGAFESSTSFSEYDKSDRQLSLLNTILEYIQKNFCSDCSLTRLSKEIKYDYSYLSKFFCASVGHSFHEYVTMTRINHACYLLSSTDMTVIEISSACGFGSLRSFNRNFSQQTGHSPAAYRNLISKESRGHLDFRR